MSSDMAEEVSTMMDCGAFTTLGDIVPPRDPDEEESEEEEDEEDDRTDEPAVVRSRMKTKAGKRGCRLL